MITLDYQTNNPRWGWCGVKFTDWVSYSFTLGYLSNPDHYENISGGDIALLIERNDKQGAWDEEGRIHYYGEPSVLMAKLRDLYNCSSAGTGGSVTLRINSNGYVFSLVDDYNFIKRPRPDGSTMDVFPPASPKDVRTLLKTYLDREGLSDPEIDDCLAAFDEGFDL